MLEFTEDELVQNAREAYEAGELIAQNPQSGRRGVLFNGECVCALGASIPRDQRPEYLDVMFGFSVGETGQKLMSAHDDWANNPDRKDHHKRFRQLIGLED